MIPTRAPEIIDRLVALFTETLAADAGLAEVRVLDGPTLTAGSDSELVTVGWDGDDQGDGQAIETTQNWAGLGAGAKDEVLQVTCAVIAWSGSTDMRPRRIRCYEILSALAAALRDDASLGLPPPTLAAFSAGGLWQSQVEGGAEVRVVFTVAVKTRI